jgi:site-specific DNA-methyltransferase (adenine-specific)
MSDRITDRIEIVNADCYTLLDAWPSDAALVTDPPYGIAWDTGYDFGLGNSSAPHAKNLVRKVHKPIAGDGKPFDPAPFLRFKTVCLWGCNYFMGHLPEGGLLVWDKRTESGKAFMSEAEAAWVNRKGKVRMFSHCWQGFSRAGENSQHFHPTQKPVAVLAWCLDVCGVRDGLVIDPFMGSGSLGVACHRAGLRYLGVEIDPEHYATAKARLQRETAQGLLCMPNAPHEPPPPKGNSR